MDDKITIDKLDLLEFMRGEASDCWIIYASQIYDGQLLRFWTNAGAKEYIVERDAYAEYQGKNTEEAITAWKHL